VSTLLTSPYESLYYQILILNDKLPKRMGGMIFLDNLHVK